MKTTACFIICISIALIGCHRAVTPEEVSLAFLSALRDKDFKTAKQYAMPETQSYIGYFENGILPENDNYDIEIVGIKENKNRARIKYKIGINSYAQNLSLVKVDGNWKVYMAMNQLGVFFIESPKTVARKFIEAIESKSYEEAKKYGTEETKTMVGFLSLAKASNKTHEFIWGDEMISFDKASVKYKENGADKEQEVGLIMKDGKWLVSMTKQQMVGSEPLPGLFNTGPDTVIKATETIK